MEFTKEQIAFLSSDAFACSLDSLARQNEGKRVRTGLWVSAKYSLIPSKGWKKSFRIEKPE